MCMKADNCHHGAVNKPNFQQLNLTIGNTQLTGHTMKHLGQSLQGLAKCQGKGLWSKGEGDAVG